MIQFGICLKLKNTWVIVMEVTLYVKSGLSSFLGQTINEQWYLGFVLK